MPSLFSSIALAAFACAPVLATAATTVDPDRFDLQIGPGDGAAVKANADLKAAFPQFTSDLRLTVLADPKFPGEDPFKQTATPAASQEGVGLNAAWDAAQATRLDLMFSDTLSQSWRAAALGLINDHQVSTDDRTGRIGLTVRPFSQLALSLDADTAQKSVQDVASGASLAAGTHSVFAATRQTAGAGLTWKPWSWAHLDARGRLETGAASWRGAPAGQAASSAAMSYAYFEPSLTGGVVTPGRGDLSLTFEHAVSPLDPALFGAFAAAPGRAPDARLSPNREWRYRLNFNQTLAGQVRITAALTAARIESATELGPVGTDLQAPISVAGGERQAADVTLTAPLAMIGLPGFTLKGTGAWTASQVRDPFTGELRRASAETPEVGTLDLTQSLTREARWGLEGHFGGDQSLYQMREVTNLAASDSLGGFVEYQPGPFAVRLQVDGLYGGGRIATDVFYDGPRANGVIDRIDHHADDNQSVRLILSKAL